MAWCKKAPPISATIFPSLHPHQGRHPPKAETLAKGQGDSSSGPTTNPQNIQFSILVPRTFLLLPSETCKGRHTRPISTVASIPHGQYVRRKHGLHPTSTHNTPAIQEFVKCRTRHRACLRFLSPSLRSSPRTRRPSRSAGAHTADGVGTHTADATGRNTWLFFAGFVLFRCTRRLGDEEEGDEKGKGRAQVEFGMSFPLCRSLSARDVRMCVDADARSWRRRCRIMAGVSLVTCVPFIILLAVLLSRRSSIRLFQFALRMSMFSAARSTSSHPPPSFSRKIEIAPTVARST
ncbi:hypothetical protein B0H14DRAFT_2983749 [Mycena olivaceomarginata]|nr:hypothetical protein B0H14DRAFT_2983749 [Mycena olivaceomarginata]